MKLDKTDVNFEEVYISAIRQATIKTDGCVWSLTYQRTSCKQEKWNSQRAISRYKLPSQTYSIPSALQQYCLEYIPFSNLMISHASVNTIIGRSVPVRQGRSIHLEVVRAIPPASKQYTPQVSLFQEGGSISLSDELFLIFGKTLVFQLDVSKFVVSIVAWFLFLIFSANYLPPPHYMHRMKCTDLAYIKVIPLNHLTSICI